MNYVYRNSYVNLLSHSIHQILGFIVKPNRSKKYYNSVKNFIEQIYEIYSRLIYDIIFLVNIIVIWMGTPS